MGAAYTILGKTFQPHQLALATIGLVTLLAIPKPGGAKKETTPQINASSPEEEAFIKEYLAKHDQKHD
ncbi:hypothetical protein PP7435_CHR3-1075 [Komagataella phaffii CBS 7435]|uniref:ATP synthase subunit K, mitochondrial n=2 Tax=Komagataella phaffii TaxID=460519 RepID=C4R3Q2_KOMPG|nr:Hypothetical protein PAS_chr3_0161 [Komagataella phaffii GS115]CAH2450117.1 Hypothetical protein BQ9382_C3-5675 [Komagataella phaffii CBS 7435]CAY70118.1 Hypothetical protein PAS_chr3_0161 [Komagataella phaffii GS115]CCA40018.1 hypothetical protein PP7435_CHR3-1075 [Komagataella phaffii CBS 7435]